MIQWHTSAVFKTNITTNIVHIEMAATTNTKTHIFCAQ